MYHAGSLISYSRTYYITAMFVACGSPFFCRETFFVCKKSF